MKTDNCVRTTWTDLLFEIPVAFLLILWPCIAHIVQMTTHMEQYPWYPDVAVSYDFFMNVRSRWLVGTAVIMALLLSVHFIWERRCRTVKRAGILSILFWGFVCGFLALGLVSSITSVHPEMAFRGQIESCETWPVLCAYFILAAYTALCMGKGYVKHVWLFLLLGAFIQCLIGFSQMFGTDFWNSTLGRWLLLGKYSGTTDLLFMAEEAGTRQVYMTFYHANYAAVYILLCLPVCVHVFCFAETVREKAFGGITAFALAINLIGTGSRTGLIIGSAALLLFIMYKAVIYYQGKVGKTLRKGCFILIISGIGLIGVIIGGKLFLPEKQQYSLEDVRLETDGVHLIWQDESEEYILAVNRTDKGLFFSIRRAADMTVSELKPAEHQDWMGSDTWLETADGSLDGIYFWAAGNDDLCRIVMRQGEVNWVFEKYPGDEMYHYMNVFGKEDIPVKAPYAFGKGYEYALSERGYIWSRTIPLLKEHIFTGCGMDNFVFEFPHNDYVMRAELQQLQPGAIGQVTARPHSMYLQIMIQAGILALLCLAATALIIVIMAVRKYRQGKRLAAHAAVSLILFLLMGMMNDSVVVVTPVFCVLLGSFLADIN